MSRRLWVSSMLNIRAVFTFILLMIVQGCDRETTLSEDFVLCAKGKPSFWNASIDLDSRRGRWADFIGPVEMCDSSEASCISFPILFSAPPNIPDTAEDEVEWKVDEAEFSITRVGETQKTESFNITAKNSNAIYTYKYDLTRGIISMSITDSYGATDRWSRCKGQFRFVELASIVRAKPASP